MGDGIKRSFAIVINGDAAPRHLENVRQSADVLQRSGCETYVASPSKPGKVPDDHYASGNVAGVSQVIARIKAQIDDDDSLTIYTTGHGQQVGDEGKVCFGQNCFGKGLATLLDGIPYGSRTVIMDQCYSGNWNALFLDDPRTLFISAGSKNEVVCCEQFAPHFWSDNVPDSNADNVISWQERFEHTVKLGKASGSLPQHIASAGYMQGGRAPFSTGVMTVNTKSVLDQALTGLRPGQYAAIYFSSPECVPCAQYDRSFSQQANAAQGQHLFIKVTDPSVAMQNYGINSFPTVIIVDHQGNRRPVGVVHNDKLLREISLFTVSLEKRLAQRYQRVLAHPGSAEAMIDYLGTVEGAPEQMKVQTLSKLRREMMSNPANMNFVTAYMAVISMLEPAQRNAEGARIRGLFSHSNVVIGARMMGVFSHLSKEWSPSERVQGARGIRLAMQSRQSIMQDVATQYYADMAEDLPLAELRRGAAEMQKLLESSDEDFASRVLDTYLPAVQSQIFKKSGQ